ncbi:universal stress protein [Kitasatospora cineracea]|uniref:Nucleotide-binding universal stress UspA family protein n=1 Tax=Kitasatospora cineracea TaxID=88074 RepID=A0A3N4RL18_9ACTN|nr:universal stress protein [Kitasatospora cineracea]RPE31889.1 nucleotide-binding universal stress UspA family protein [Kitasatospora cineracea]
MGTDRSTRAPVVAGVAGEGAARVVRAAARQARGLGAGLVLLHAVDWSAPPGTRPSPEAVAEVVLTPWVDLVRTEFPGVEVDARSVAGSPVGVLAEASRGAALLVVGHRARRRPARLNPGSVPMGLAGRTHCPLEVVHPGRRDRPAPPRPAVVVAASGEESEDLRVLEHAFAEARLRGAALDVVHAARHPQVLAPPLAPEGQRSREGIASGAARTLGARLGPLRAAFPDVPVRMEVELGSPARALLAAAEYAELVVVGAHGRGALGRLVAGSVSCDVLHRAPCPVVVVPLAREDVAAAA